MSLYRHVVLFKNEKKENEIFNLKPKKTKNKKNKKNWLHSHYEEKITSL